MVQLRTKEVYSSHCESLGGPQALRDHIATTYGVNNSILNECRYFHVTSGLVPDIMHDILEGSLELCMRHTLIHLIRDEKLFSLDTLNSRLSSFKFGPSEVKNKPTVIAPAALRPDGHLKQSDIMSQCFWYLYCSHYQYHVIHIIMIFIWSLFMICGQLRCSTSCSK